MFYFNPRSYKRSDGLGHTVYDCTVEFQSTLLQEERRLLLQICIKNRRFQSTLLQEERPISTSLLKRAINFNPRSYKRSDHNGFASCGASLKFQSTLLQEERQDMSGNGRTTGVISIHAPTRGATIYPFWQEVYQEFQSTLLQEERRSVMRKCSAPCYFNPRSYKRSD